MVNRCGCGKCVSVSSDRELVFGQALAAPLRDLRLEASHDLPLVPEEGEFGDNVRIGGDEPVDDVGAEIPAGGFEKH